MKIVATNHPVRVDYRIPGKTYSEGGHEGEPFNTDERSSYPFDSVEIAPGQEFVGQGFQVVNAVELVGASEQAGTPD